MARSTVSRGDAFENRMYAVFKQQLESGELGYQAAWSKIFQKKGYYSHARQADIIFDIAIEVTRPGADSPMIVLIIECKDYVGTVPVSAVEAFDSKLSQLEGFTIKGIFATNSAFQSGARALARNLGFGLLRHCAAGECKWELQRSGTAHQLTGYGKDVEQIEAAMSTQTFPGGHFEIFAEMGYLATNSLWELVGALWPQPTASENFVGARSDRPHAINQVGFVEQEEIERRASEVLLSGGHKVGPVDLEALCNHLAETTGLVVSHLDRPASVAPGVMGSINFDRAEIRIYNQEVKHRVRHRFTLAHEIGHFLMGHGQYIRSEYSEAADLDRVDGDSPGATDISRLEWQANQFASCLLMPRSAFKASFLRHLAEQDLPDRGFGLLYLDSQPCNISAFSKIALAMMPEFFVSRTALRIRLKQLELLINKRATS